MPAPMSLDLRQHFIDACLQKNILGKGRWLKDLTKIFGISYNTGRNWWKRYQQERSIQPRKVVISRPNQKVTSEIIAYVRQLYENEPSMRLSDVLDHIEGQFGVRISSATLHKIRFKLGLTFKKKRSSPGNS